jgi:hypothetical protein
MIFRAATFAAPVTVFPLQIEQILSAIILFLKELIKLLNRYSLKHTNIFSTKILNILVLK